MTGQRVSALILGAQKCATTTLFGLLSQVPGIAVPGLKEADFFSLRDDWRDSVEEYHALFAGQSGATWLEASPSYTVYPHRRLEIWKDMQAYNPALRFIYLVRPPLDRMRSAYRHAFERGYTDVPFDEFLLSASPDIDCSRYAMQIEPYVETFGRDRVLFLRFEEVTRAQEETVRRVCDFLDVELPQGFQVAETRENIGAQRKYHHRFDRPAVPARLLRKVSWRAYSAYQAAASPPQLKEKPAAPPSVERAFLRLVEADIERLERITGWDLPGWRTP